MKTLVVASVLVFINGITSFYDKGEVKYSFIREEKDISIYFRWIKLYDNLLVRELKAEFNVLASQERMIAIIKNEALAKQWMKGVCEYRCVNNAVNQWRTYIQYDIPWPLNNQDCIINYELKRLSPNTLNVSLKGEPDYIPLKEGVTRIKHIQGNWTIIEINPRLCKVIYMVYSGQPSKFPRWIVDPIIQGNLINTMAALKRTVEKQ